MMKVFGNELWAGAAAKEERLNYGTRGCTEDMGRGVGNGVGILSVGTAVRGGKAAEQIGIKKCMRSV